MKGGKLLLAVVVVGALAGCAANPFSTYYTSVSLGTHVKLISLSKGSDPKLIDGGNIKLARISMLEHGYVMIGYSYFNDGVVSKRKALDQAKMVGASVVLLYSQYTNTKTSQIPLTLPSTQTTETSVYGLIGSQPFFGQGTTTTYNAHTIYIPESVQRYNYIATFWKKNAEPVEFGVLLRALTPAERRKIGGNIGFKVRAVIIGSPAFYANVLRGDVIERVGDINLRVDSDIHSAAVKYKGTSTTILLWRDGKMINEHVKMN